MTLISASLVGVYYYKVMDEDMCSRETIQTEIRYKIQKSYGGHWSFFKNLTATRISEREANCSQSDTYFHWGFLFVGVIFFSCYNIAFLNNILLITSNFIIY